MKNNRKKGKWLIALLILIVIWRLLFVHTKFESIDGKYRIIEIVKFNDSWFFWEYEYFYILINRFGYPLYTLDGIVGVFPASLMNAMTYKDSTSFIISYSESSIIKLNSTNQFNAKLIRLDCDQTNIEILNYQKSFLKGKWHDKKDLTDFKDIIVSLIDEKKISYPKNIIEFNDSLILWNNEPCQLDFSLEYGCKRDSNYFGVFANRIISDIVLLKKDQNNDYKTHRIEFVDRNHCLIWSREREEYLKYKRIK